MINLRTYFFADIGRLHYRYCYLFLSFYFPWSIFFYLVGIHVDLQVSMSYVNNVFKKIEQNTKLIIEHGLHSVIYVTLCYYVILKYSVLL